jgi:hypothetical protein
MVVITFLLNTLIDYYMHGCWSFPAFNFLKFNVLEGKASLFGTKPFYYYFTECLPFTLRLFLFLVPMGMWKLDSIPVLIYILAFSLVPHKELRFISSAFPILQILAGIGFNTCRWNTLKKIFIILIVFFHGFEITDSLFWRYYPAEMKSMSLVKKHADRNETGWLAFNIFKTPFQSFVHSPNFDVSWKFLSQSAYDMTPLGGIEYSVKEIIEKYWDKFPEWPDNIAVYETDYNEGVIQEKSKLLGFTYRVEAVFTSGHFPFIGSDDNSSTILFLSKY